MKVLAEYSYEKLRILGITGEKLDIEQDLEECTNVDEVSKNYFNYGYFVKVLNVLYLL